MRNLLNYFSDVGKRVLAAKIKVMFLTAKIQPKCLTKKNVENHSFYLKGIMSVTRVQSRLHRVSLIVFAFAYRDHRFAANDASVDRASPRPWLGPRGARWATEQRRGAAGGRSSSAGPSRARPSDCGAALVTRLGNEAAPRGSSGVGDGSPRPSASAWTRPGGGRGQRGCRGRCAPATPIRRRCRRRRGANGTQASCGRRAAGQRPTTARPAIMDRTDVVPASGDSVSSAGSSREAARVWAGPSGRRGQQRGDPKPPGQERLRHAREDATAPSVLLDVSGCHHGTPPRWSGRRGRTPPSPSRRTGSVCPCQGTPRKKRRTAATATDREGQAPPTPPRRRAVAPATPMPRSPPRPQSVRGDGLRRSGCGRVRRHHTPASSSCEAGIKWPAGGSVGSQAYGRAHHSDVSDAGPRRGGRKEGGAPL